MSRESLMFVFDSAVTVFPLMIFFNGIIRKDYEKKLRMVMSSGGAAAVPISLYVNSAIEWKSNGTAILFSLLIIFIQIIVFELFRIYGYRKQIKKEAIGEFTKAELEVLENTLRKEQEKLTEAIDFTGYVSRYEALYKEYGSERCGEKYLIGVPDEEFIKKAVKLSGIPGVIEYDNKIDKAIVKYSRDISNMKCQLKVDIRGNIADGSWLIMKGKYTLVNIGMRDVIVDDRKPNTPLFKTEEDLAYIIGVYRELFDETLNRYMDMEE